MASPLPPVAALSEEYQGTATRVFGPPGTGKTTFLKGYVREVVERNGPESVAVASFSVTAATHIADELKKTDGPQLPKSAVGTLHSHAFRAIGHGNVALDPKILADWNEQATPELRITPSTRGGGNDSGAFSGNAEDAQTGDELLGALDKLRAMMTPEEDWPENVRKFNARYAAWKREAGAADFTDMISLAIERAMDGESMPGNPDFFIVDEAQDNTPLEFTLVTRWAVNGNCQRLVLGGDDDQAINGWRGADPGPLLALHGPNVTDKILDQSHRVPEAVRVVAERWVHNIGERKEKTYRPRMDDQGRMVLGTASLVPESLNNPALVTRVMEDVERGNSVMILATCNYMLETVLKHLRAEGIPFHNPYRPAEGRWNPLGTAREDGMSTAERVFRYMLPSETLGAQARLWTGEDVQAWLELIKPTTPASGMVRTAKKLAATFPAKDVVPEEDFYALFKPEAHAEGAQLDRVLESDVNWLAENLLKDKQQPASYPIQIVRTVGAQALATPPRVVVGTVHSVKGAAADVVYLAPDISTAAANGLAKTSGSDELTRTFYVGMTRAYKHLRLLAPVTPRHISRKQLIPTELEVGA